MRIAKVIGSVTLGRCHPSLVGESLRVVIPLSLANLSGQNDRRADDFVALDEMGAGVGSLVGVSEGAEAAQPFYPDTKPIDAYCAAILDQVHVSAANRL